MRSTALLLALALLTFSAPSQVQAPATNSGIGMFPGLYRSEGRLTSAHESLAEALAGETAKP